MLSTARQRQYPFPSTTENGADFEDSWERLKSPTEVPARALGGQLQLSLPPFLPPSLPSSHTSLMLHKLTPEAEISNLPAVH